MKTSTEHPYIGRKSISTPAEERRMIRSLNSSRCTNSGPSVEVDYYFEVINRGKRMDGLKNAARMVMEHGTLKSWHDEGDTRIVKPDGYDENMSWITGFKLFKHSRRECMESGMITIAYPLAFFDRTGKTNFPMAQLMMAIASESVSAFSFYRAAKIADIRLPAELKDRLPTIKWPHKRIRKYLGIGPSDPIIGTIVKPKTGLTPELFSRAVVDAALAGARFTKADENMHLSLKDIPLFVGRTVRVLENAGFDLGRFHDRPRGTRFLFAPHITADEKNIKDYAKAAIEAGANALMFSPHYGGGFLTMAEIAQRFDVPIYAHTAGMNIITGCPFWGIDPSLMYLFAAYFGAAFMQLGAAGGYLRPDDEEKKAILKRLSDEGLQGNNGMTLVIAGGIGPANIGFNMKRLGTEGRMYLAGTSVYSHPDGVAAGVKALILAHRAYSEKGVTDTRSLINFGKSMGAEGEPLVNALRKGASG